MYQFGGIIEEMIGIIPEALSDIEIMDIKKTLAKNGLYKGRIDAEIDDDFRLALENAQKASKQEQTRYPGARRSNRLEEDAPTADMEQERIQQAKAGGRMPNMGRQYGELIKRYNQPNKYLYGSYLDDNRRYVPRYKRMDAGGLILGAAGDYFKGIADGVTNVVGLDPIKDDMYKTKLGKFWSGYQETVMPAAADMALNILAPGAGAISGAARQAVRTGTKDVKGLQEQPQKPIETMNPMANRPQTSPYGTWGGDSPTRDSQRDNELDSNVMSPLGDYQRGGAIPTKKTHKNLDIRVLGKANKKSDEVPGVFVFRGDKHGEDTDKDGMEGIPVALDGTRNPVAEVEKGEIYLKSGIDGNLTYAQEGGPIEGKGDMILSNHIDVDGKVHRKGPTVAKRGMKAVKNLNQLYSRPRDKFSLNTIANNYEYLSDLFQKQEEGKYKTGLRKLLRSQESTLQDIVNFIAESNVPQKKGAEQEAPEGPPVDVVAQNDLIDTRQTVDMSDPSNTPEMAQERAEMMQNAPRPQTQTARYGAVLGTDGTRSFTNGYSRQVGTMAQGGRLGNRRLINFPGNPAQGSPIGKLKNGGLPKYQSSYGTEEWDWMTETVDPTTTVDAGAEGPVQTTADTAGGGMSMGAGDLISAGTSVFQGIGKGFEKMNKKGPGTVELPYAARGLGRSGSVFADPNKSMNLYRYGGMPKYQTGPGFAKPGVDLADYPVDNLSFEHPVDATYTDPFATTYAAPTDPRMTSPPGAPNFRDQFSTPFDDVDLNKVFGDPKPPVSEEEEGWKPTMGDYMQLAAMGVDAIGSGIYAFKKPEVVAAYTLNNRFKGQDVNIQPYLDQINLATNAFNRSVDESVRNPMMASSMKLAAHANNINALNRTIAQKQNVDYQRRWQADMANAQQDKYNSALKTKVAVENAKNRAANDEARAEWFSRIAEYFSRSGIMMNQVMTNGITAGSLEALASHIGVDVETMRGAVTGVGIKIKDDAKGSYLNLFGSEEEEKTSK
jgi:hypothetical protein